MARPSEDDLIARYFRPLATSAGAFQLKDDCATLKPEPGEELVLKTDAIAEGIHFFSDDKWHHVAQKALRVNLSDLAAKGATPAGYLLSLALPETWSEAQLADFTDGLAEDQKAFDVSLLGGDTIRSPKGLVITITVIGRVAEGRMARRGGAQAGDVLYVSGTIGDSALGLMLRLTPDVVEASAISAENMDFLADRYLLPRPRVGLIPAVAACAHGAMDISDGLLLDATRMARASGVAIDIDVAAVPLSSAARAIIAADPKHLQRTLTGGDDYELLLSIPSDAIARFEAMAAEAGIAVTPIGRVITGGGTLCLLDAGGHEVTFTGGGFQHF
jgi:thiamine-monophosphate kinase